jgi:hypothetical protein
MAVWIWSGEQVAPITLEGIQVTACLICGVEGNGFFYTWTNADGDDVDSITMGLCGGPQCLNEAHKWVKNGTQPINPVSGTRALSNWRAFLASLRGTRATSNLNRLSVKDETDSEIPALTQSEFHSIGIPGLGS